MSSVCIPLCYICMKDINSPESGVPKINERTVFCSHVCFNLYLNTMEKVNKLKKAAPLITRSISPITPLPNTEGKSDPKISKVIFTIKDKTGNKY